VGPAVSVGNRLPFRCRTSQKKDRTWKKFLFIDMVASRTNTFGANRNLLRLNDGAKAIYGGDNDRTTAFSET
jgi:hypothetical protein